MPYDTENILTSKKPYQVFAEIVREKDGSYGAKVARKLDIKQQSASEIINKLHEVGLLEKGKRTKAQYYKLNKNGLVKSFLGLWESQVVSDIKRSVLEDLVEMQEDSIDYSDLMVLLKLYTEHYTHNEENSNIEKMLVDDFFEELESLVEHQGRENISEIIGEEMYEDFPEVPDWLEDLYYLLKFSLSSIHKHNLDYALQDYHEWKEG